MTKLLNKIAIIGRPNVGKSALFNRIIGQRVAIVDRKPGITRDRLGAEAEWFGTAFTLIDTGGIGIGSDEPLVQQVQLQAEIAIAEAAVILLVVDVIDGIMPLDREVADILRRKSEKVILAANKCDNQKLADGAAVFHELGFPKVFPISAFHGRGIDDLLDAAAEMLPQEDSAPPEEESRVKVAVVGKPNAGKSTLINSLINENRLVVDSLPGTTRDAIDVPYQSPSGKKFLLIDTAGIKRKRKIKQAVEKYSLIRSEQAIARCDVALMMVDAEAGISTTDARIARMITSSGKSCIITTNKWDLIRGVTQRDYREEVYDRLRFLSFAPVIFISAATGKNVEKAMRTINFVHRQGLTKISTPEINQIIHKAQERHQPPLVSGRRLKIYYVTQTSTAPARFLIFVNDPDLLKTSYLNYLVNQIRRHHPYTSIPILFDLRRRNNK